MRDVILAPPGFSESIDEGDRRLLAVRAEGQHVDLEDHVYQCKDGSLRAVSISASPLFIGSAVEGAVVVFRDLTEDKSEQHRIRRELDALTWVGRIREALDEERFVLHAQPIVPLKGGDRTRRAPPQDGRAQRRPDRANRIPRRRREVRAGHRD